MQQRNKKPLTFQVGLGASTQFHACATRKNRPKIIKKKKANTHAQIKKKTVGGDKNNATHNKDLSEE